MNMSIEAVITIVISITGLIGTLIGVVVKLSMNVGRYMQQQESLENELKTQNERNRIKFDDYYAFKLAVSNQLSSISEKLEAILDDMKEIKSDIKEKKQ